MRESLAAITVDGWLERMAQLALRHGVHLSTLQQKDGRDFELIFASALLHFPSDRLLDERGANEVLKAFLAGSGAMLATDHVELRRWLVDTGVLARDGFGRAYALGRPRADVAAAVTALAPHDPAELARAVRAEDAARRAERKARWAAGTAKP
jgi:hypothetical protein